MIGLAAHESNQARLVSRGQLNLIGPLASIDWLLNQIIHYKNKVSSLCYQQLMHQPLDL